MNGWRPAELIASRFETASARTLTLRVERWPGHRPGQHVDVRLTAPDGYRAERSYSLASPADDDLIELTVQRVPDGEVSGYLVDGLEVGEQIEIRGPVGGWFVWDPITGGDALLVAGGSGIVPIMAMLRAWRRAATTTRVRTVYALRDPGQLYYREELLTEPDLLLAYSRIAAPGGPRPAGRLTREELSRYAPGGDTADDVTCFVCGPTGFVETTAAALVESGHAPERIRTERFGPSGGSRG